MIFLHHSMTTRSFTCRHKPKGKLRLDVLGTLLHIQFPSQKESLAGDLFLNVKLLIMIITYPQYIYIIFMIITIVMSTIELGSNLIVICNWLLCETTWTDCAVVILGSSLIPRLSPNPVGAGGEPGNELFGYEFSVEKSSQWNLKWNVMFPPTILYMGFSPILYMIVWRIPEISWWCDRWRMCQISHTNPIHIL